MACKYYINNKVLNEQEIKEYIGSSYIKESDIKYTTIGDIADILAYSNSKLILDGYEVEYTTPDNEKFKTYQEASNHISDLAKNVKDVKDVDLNNIEIDKTNYVVYSIKSNYIQKQGFKTKEDALSFAKKHLIDGTYEIDLLEKFNTATRSSTTEELMMSSFIDKNKEYERSKEIIEEWKKVNNIQYNPEEIYSRGQEFSSVVGAYSEFDINLMMQNLLSHIEDNEKAGGKFAISAYTKPIDRTISHLEGGGGKIKFKIYPKSEDILWAANKDVYSGSVWDASEKVNKDKKSELLGVSYTKYPFLRNVDAVQPNLASIVDDLNHHHNELGIVLTGNNFRLEYDEDIPYTTKKIIDGINKILDQKYGKLVKPEIKTPKKLTLQEKNELQNLKDLQTEAFKIALPDFLSVEDFFSKKDQDRINELQKTEGIQPTQTNETLKESIESVKNKVSIYGGKRVFNTYTELNKGSIVTVEGQIGEYYIESVSESNGEIGVGITNLFYDLYPINEFDPETNPNGQHPLFNVPEKAIKQKEDKEKEYTEQALINTKIAAFKEVAKKYPRSLIRSEVVRTREYWKGEFSEFKEDELTFQKIPTQIKQGVNELFDSNPELANQVYETLGFKNKLKTFLGKELEYKDAYISANRLKDFKQYQVLDEKGNDIGSVVIEYRGDKNVILHPKLNISGKGYGKDLYKLISSKFNVEIQEWNEGGISKSDSAKAMWDSLEKKGSAKRIVDVEQGDNFRILKYNNQITPQQKQQAQQLYQSFLDVYLEDFEQVEKILKEENIIEKDCSGGKLKAKDGIATLFEKGGKWEVITDFKNAPTHKSGGKDISIQGKKVEIEKNELRIENDFGDVAVIPSKYRIEVQDAIKSNCHSCIDGIVESLPKMKDYAGDGTVFPFFGRYRRFKNSLPDNLKNTPESDYAMRYYWRHGNKPKSFDEALNREQPMFTMENDGFYHAPSVEPNTLRFLKPKNHPTLQYELDWYNSDNPDAVDFRSKYDLDTKGKFYRYVPKKQ